MVASWRPDIAVQTAFSANPNDPNAIPTWTDLTARFRTAKQVTAGRQYELDTNQANQPTLSFLDQDEWLNPANTSSPYAPNVVPYRQILWQAQWPNTTVGNLLNTAYGSNASLHTTNGYDPTFEAYTAGTTVPWITAVGGTTPLVGTTTPHGGTKDLAWSVVNGAAQQGASLQVPCIPGRQYTDSLFVRQSSASTQQIGVTDQTLVLDPFNRTASNGWGTSPIGGAWSVSGVSNAEFSVSANTAVQSLATVSTVRSSFIGTNIRDVTVTARAKIPVVAKGGSIQARVVLRRVDANNFYMLEARCNVDNSINVQIWSVVAGVSTSLAFAFAPFGYTAGTSLWLRFTASGPTLSGVCWLDGTPAFTGATVTATDTSLTAGAAVGCHSSLNSLNSNTLPVPIAWSNFSAIGTVYGTSTSTTGSYQRLSVTYTASQPTHTLQLATAGTAVAGTVLLDDIQHEEGASPTTFTTTGPTIHGVFRGFVERWPSRWDYMGFLGEADVICVDAFGPQSLIGLWTEYRNAVLAKKPNYYWTLAEPQGATLFAETSGNNGPPLTRIDSKTGAATTFTPGTQTNIPGDPSGVGVLIDGPYGSPSPATCLQAGKGTPGVAVGGVLPVSVTAAAWFLHSPYGPTDFGSWLTVIDFPTGNTLANVQQAAGTPNQIWSVAVAQDASHNTQSTVAQVNDTWADGKPHLLVTTTTISAGSMVTTLWIDGTQVATNTVIATFSTAPTCPVVEIGGYVDQNGVGLPGLVNGTYAHLALWNRALSSAEITDLWNAGKGYPAETSGQRIARYLSYGWLGPTSIDTGQSIMGLSNLSAGTSLLQANQDVTTTENGNYWADDWGNTTFAARTRRYLETTSRLTFGEDVANGEFPYLGEIQFDVDPTLVFNAVEVDNAGGVTAVATDVASQFAYFQRAYQRQLNVRDNNEAIDAARYLLGQHKDPHLRVQAITLDPASNPALWPVVLALKIGQRVTVKRRAKAANGGAGLTIQGDFFVEQKSLDQVDVRAGIWTYKLYLSPVDLAQVGILDNTTYGRLGTAGAVLRDAITAGAATAVVNLTGGDLFTTSGTFQATIDSEIVTVTVVSGVSSPQTLTITRPTDGTAVAHNSGAPVQVYQPFVLAY